MRSRAGQSVQDECTRDLHSKGVRLPSFRVVVLLLLLTQVVNFQTTGLSNTDVPQNEGQHLQTVYPKAYQLGGMLG
eukprot:m.180296 g.180296  ORF g.180296 m.180296 type:complete len:76 (-) comp14946_c0_seq3:2161-2388(-)